MAIAGLPRLAKRVMGRFGWGLNFLKLNAELLAEYAQCADGAAVIEAVLSSLARSVARSTSSRAVCGEESEADGRTSSVPRWPRHLPRRQPWSGLPRPWCAPFPESKRRQSFHVTAACVTMAEPRQSASTGAGSLRDMGGGRWRPRARLGF